MKRFLTIILVAGLYCCALGQNFEDAFGKFEQNNQKSFNNFTDSINKAFAKSMVANIETFSCEVPKIKDQKPKPENNPRYPGEPQQVRPDLPKPELPKNDEPELPEENETQSQKPENNNPNHWAIYNLVKRFAGETYETGYDEQVVMTVFLLNQLGVESEIGYANDHLFCLLNISQQLYGISFVDIKGKRHYTFELNPKLQGKGENPMFRTYDVSFPLPTNSIDMECM